MEPAKETDVNRHHIFVHNLIGVTCNTCFEKCSREVTLRSPPCGGSGACAVGLAAGLGGGGGGVAVAFVGASVGGDGGATATAASFERGGGAAFGAGAEAVPA